MRSSQLLRCDLTIKARGYYCEVQIRVARSARHYTIKHTHRRYRLTKTLRPSPKDSKPHDTTYTDIPPIGSDSMILGTFSCQKRCLGSARECRKRRGERLRPIISRERAQEWSIFPIAVKKALRQSWYVDEHAFLRFSCGHTGMYVQLGGQDWD